MERKRTTKARRGNQRATRPPKDDLYVLRLYVAGATPFSQRSIENVKTLCEQRLKGRYQLEVVDIYQQPQLAQGVQVTAAPTLIRFSPSLCAD